jgi:asparagine synthase (glutamine-hydrolysing)
MCGIFGMFDPVRLLPDSAGTWAELAQSRLQHRGPDGRRCLSLMDGRCLLGHLRLSIIDLERGAQPISNEDRTIWVVCNGEIYNYLELREQLLARGHILSTRSDTEVLVHLFEEKGPSLLDDLEGMFAFAIVDTRREQLFLARDRFGEKPLYCAPVHHGTGLAFASELKALLPLENVDLSPDTAAVAQFLALGYIPAPRTYFAGISKLRAGEAILVSTKAGRQVFQYWRPEFPQGNWHRPLSKNEAVEEVQRRFREAVRLRLRSDVPVGAFLSGGIDSSLVASTIRDLLPNAAFTTFCASFDDEEFNEAPYAKKIAEHIGSDHHEVRFSSAELLQIFETLIDHYDEPFADPSMFPTFAVCRAASQHCKVMLSGDGGDECFAGYRQFFTHSRWHPIRRLPGVQDSAQFLFDAWGPQWRGRGLLNFLRKDDWQLLYPEPERTSTLACFQPDFRAAATTGLQELREASLRHSRLTYPQSAMEEMISGYLPEQILVKVDRASMFSAVECRTPFLDRNLFELAASLPLHYHFARGQGKALLRRCLPDWVSPEVRWRKKQGFTPPLDTWFRTSLRRQIDDAITDVSRVFGHMIVPGRVQEIYQEHLAGADRSSLLFRWLVLSRRTGRARSMAA